jgi:hypothetical protein
LTIPRFLAAPEIAVVAGNVLKAAYAEPLSNKGQKEKVEKDAIERIPRSRYIKRYEKPESIQNRLLLCIGPDQLLAVCSPRPLIPNNADDAVRSRARELFSRVLSSFYEHLQKAIDLADSEAKAKIIKALMSHVDAVAMRIYFSLDLKPELRMPEKSLVEEHRRQLYLELKPLIAALATVVEESPDTTWLLVLPTTYRRRSTASCSMTQVMSSSSRLKPVKLPLL